MGIYQNLIAIYIGHMYNIFRKKLENDQEAYLWDMCIKV